MSNLFSNTKKAMMAAAAVATLATGVTVTSTSSAEAQWNGRHFGAPGWRANRGYVARGYGYRPYRGGRGVGVAAGLIGGLAAGALIAGATNAYAAPAYSYGYAPVYQPSYGYAPAYYGGTTYYSAPAYAPTCYTRRVRERVDYDTVVIRRVRVCN